MSLFLQDSFKLQLVLMVTSRGPTSLGVWGTWLSVRWQLAKNWMPCSPSCPSAQPVVHGHGRVLHGGLHKVQKMSFGQWPKGWVTKLCFLLLQKGLSPACYPMTRQESKQPFRKHCRLCWITNWGGWSQQLYYLWKWKITLYTTVTAIHPACQCFSGSHHLSPPTNNCIATSVQVNMIVAKAGVAQSQLPPCAHVICIFRMLCFLTKGLTSDWPQYVASMQCWFYEEIRCLYP